MLDSTVHRVYVLGAGFSKAVGLPLAAELLPWTLARLRAEAVTSTTRGTVPDQDLDIVTAAIRELYADPASCPDDIEELLSLLDDAVSIADATRGHLLQAVPFAADIIRPWMCRTLDTAQKAARQDPRWMLHVEWARRLQPGDVVVSFNYDTLAEQALEEAGVPWMYAFEGFKSGRGKVIVAKPHGSLNWKLFEAGVAPKHPDRFTTLHADGPYDGSVQAVAAVAYLREAPFDYPDPGAVQDDEGVLIVAPTRGKKYEWFIADQLRAAFRAVSDAEEVVVVGYSLPDGDGGVHAVLRVGVRLNLHGPDLRFHVVDIRGPDPTRPVGERIADRYRRRICASARWTGHDGLAEWVSPASSHQ